MSAREGRNHNGYAAVDIAAITEGRLINKFVSNDAKKMKRSLYGWESKPLINGTHTQHVAWGGLTLGGGSQEKDAIYAY